MLAYLKRVPPEAILGCRSNAAHASEYITGKQPDTETLALKRSWDGLHFLLSTDRRKLSNAWDTSAIWNTADIMGMAVIGKDVLNPECRLGLFAPKWIPPGTVAQISFRLKATRWETLDEAYSADRMRDCGVYPEDFWDDEEKARMYLKYWYSQLSKFYEKAASVDQAIICYLELQTAK